MKRLLLISTLLLVFNSYSQDEKFSGIGIFKLKSDSSALFEYAKSKKFKIKEIPSSKTSLASYFPIKNAMGKIVDDNKYHFTNKCPLETIYFLSSYVVNGINMENITLTYFNNKLEKFECTYSEEIIDAIEAKYGKIKVETINDTAKCIYKFTGNERYLISTSYAKNLFIDNIFLSASHGMSYNSNCEDMPVSHFEYSILSDPDYNKCTEEANKPQPKIDKNKLNDF